MSDMRIINNQPYLVLGDTLYTLRVTSFAGIYKNGRIVKGAYQPLCIIMEDMKLVKVRCSRYLYDKETGDAYHLRIGNKVGSFIGDMICPCI